MEGRCGCEYRRLVGGALRDELMTSKFQQIDFTQLLKCNQNLVLNRR